MKKAIVAVLFHCASSKENECHDNCPKGNDSWCKYQRIFQIRRQHVPGQGLPKNVILHVKLIFVELSEYALLEKCLHGKTQNQNESFNGMIWQRIPKGVRVNAATFEMRVYDALSHFNLGNIATVNIYNYLGFHSGHYTLFGLDCNNKKWVNNYIRKSTEVDKNRRRYLCTLHIHICKKLKRLSSYKNCVKRMINVLRPICLIGIYNH